MDATLVTVTVLSMTMAAALSAIVWRMLRLERQRSNARVAALRAAALVVASVVLFSLAARAPKGRATRSATPANASEAAATPAGAELELISLRDARQTGTLTITGQVQNPRTGVHLSRVAVTAYTFDDH